LIYEKITIMPKQKSFYISLLALCTLFAWGTSQAADMPLIGIATIRSNSPRTAVFTTFLEDSLVRIAETTGTFKPVNPALLREELKKFGCTDERCLIGFARDAGINLIIRGDIDDTNDFITLSLRAYGIDIPFQDRIIYRYSVRVPMTGKFGEAEYRGIIEEHSGKFFSKLMARYQLPLFVKAGGDGSLKVDINVSGNYTLYRAEMLKEKNALRGISKIGAFRFDRGTLAGPQGAAQAGDFILIGFEETAATMDKFYYERKKEIVFKKPVFVDTIYALLLTGPASAVMPLIAPTLGYYRSSDWQGLPLWAFNSVPYLYLEINGLSNYWANYYKKKKTVPRDAQAQYYFGLYMLSAGGMSLFVDAFAHSYLDQASNYQGVQAFMGNAVTAGYLALVSGGGGHFYRGDRLWGYLYYHADNLLLYFTLREFLPDKKFDALTRTFSTSRINKVRAYSLLSSACAVKLAEIIHAVLMKDNIGNGTIIDEGYSVEPAMFIGEGAALNVGMQCSYRW
jgi:hypothetical protein